MKTSYYQFQLLGQAKQLINPCLNNARLSNKWLTSTKTSYYDHPHCLGMDTKPVPAPRTDKSQKQPNTGISSLDGSQNS